MIAIVFVRSFSSIGVESSSESFGTPSRDKEMSQRGHIIVWNIERKHSVAWLTIWLSVKFGTVLAYDPVKYPTKVGAPLMK